MADKKMWEQIDKQFTYRIIVRRSFEKFALIETNIMLQ